ncbi:hypothetical protein BZA70DRAFT_273385 [Myxozyma melibiosi]|uniref:Uncharacterized protein n=1 Tax=Myxozyma melibiosi TaxID=54550 RepID=A0ABR1FEP4_9ASCO
MVMLRRQLRKLDCLSRSFSTTSSTLKAKRKSRDKKVHFNEQAYRQPALKVDTRHAQDLLVKDKRRKKLGGIQNHDDSDPRLSLLFLVYCVQQIQATSEQKSDSRGASFVAEDDDDAAEKDGEREWEQSEDRDIGSAKSKSRSSSGKPKAGSTSGRGRKLRGRQLRNPLRDSSQRSKVKNDISELNLRKCIHLYTHHFRPLVEAEEQVEKKEIRNRLENWPLEELVSKGYTLVSFPVLLLHGSFTSSYTHIMKTYRLIYFLVTEGGS